MIIFKKNFILFLIFGFIFSCKIEFEYNENAKIEGVWQPIRVRTSGTYLGFPFVKVEDTNTCQGQSRVIYKADFTGTDDESGTCDNVINRTFTYQFDTSSKSLKHIYSDGNTKTVEVLSLTSNTLVIKTKKKINGVMADLEITNTKVQ